MPDFVDAQAMHQSHPHSFHVPSEAQLEALGIGDFVKVSCNAEAFWVEVSVVNVNEVSGVISNPLVRPQQPFNQGSTIHFRKINIYAIMPPVPTQPECKQQ